MDKRKPALAAIGILAIIFTADAVWFFAFGLPQHPPAAAPTPLQSRASLKMREAYEMEKETAEVQDWDRQRVINTAIVIPGVALLCAAVILFIRSTS